VFSFAVDHFIWMWRSLMTNYMHLEWLLLYGKG